MALSYGGENRIPVTISTTTTANPVSGSVTLGVNSKAVVAMIFYAAATQRTGGDPTFSGSAMTQIESLAGVTEASCEMWYIRNMSTSGSWLNIPNDNTRTMWVNIVTINAPNGYTVEVDDTGINETTAANPTVQLVTTVSDFFAVACVATGDNGFNPTAQRGTEIYNDDPAAYGSASQYLSGSATGTCDMFFTEATSDDYGAIAVAFKEVVGTFTLVVQNSTQLQTAQNTALTQHYLLSASNATQSQNSENVNLIQIFTLSTNNSSHVHTSENLIVTYNEPAIPLVTQDAIQYQYVNSDRALNITDNFNRTSLGGNWTVEAGSPYISGGAVFTTTTSAYTTLNWNFENFGPPVEFYVTVGNLPATDTVAAAYIDYCIDDTLSNYYRLHMDIGTSTSARLRLWKRVAGTSWVSLGVSSTLTFSERSSIEIGIKHELNGQANAYLDRGSGRESVISAKDLDFLTKNHVEIRLYDLDEVPPFSFDNFIGGTILSLKQNYSLTVNNATHIQTSENVSLAQNYLLTVQDSTNLQTSENILLTLHYSLLMQDSEHIQNSGNITLSSTIEIDDIVLLTLYEIVVQNSTQAQTSENINLTQNYLLAVQDAEQLHTSENINLTQNYSIDINDVIQKHIIIQNFPSTRILDNFNRADSNPLDGNWDNGFYGDSAARLISYEIANQNDDGWYAGIRYKDIYEPDCEVFLTVSTVHPTLSVLLFLRVGGSLSSPNGYCFRLHNPSGDETNSQIYVTTSGVEYPIGNKIPLSVSNGDKIALRAIGNTIIAYLYTGGTWSEIDRATDSTYQDGGYFGIEFRGATYRLDDFGGGNITGNITLIENPVLMVQDTTQLHTSENISLINNYILSINNTEQIQNSIIITSILDDFNRDNQEPINSNWDGPAYPGDVPMRIANNQLAPGTTGNATSSYWNTSFEKNQEIYLTNVSVGDDFVLETRLVNPGLGSLTYYYLWANVGSSNLYIRRCDSGAHVTLFSTSFTYANGYKYKFSSIEDIHTAYVDKGSGWEKIYSVEDTTYLNGGYIAVYSAKGGDTNRFDDLGGGNLNITLTQNYLLVVQDAEQLHTSESIELITTANLTVQNAVQTQICTQAFSTTPLLDNFNRADESPIGGNWVGPIYPAGEGHGVFSIKSNQLGESTGEDLNSDYWNTSFNQDQEIWITYSTLSVASNHNFGLLTRIVDPNTDSVDDYILYCQPDMDEIDIYKHVNKSSTLLSQKTFVFASGQRFGFSSIGDIHTGYVDTGDGWRPIISAKDSTFMNGGYIGVYSDRGQDARFDDFGGGNHSVVTNIILTQNYTLVVQDATQLHTSENIELVTTVNLTVQNTVQAQNTNNYRFQNGAGGDINTNKDTYLYWFIPDSNYGTNSELNVNRANAPEPNHSAALFQFDISSLAGKTVTGVTFNVYFTSLGSSTLQCYRILPANDWVESEATGNIRKTGSAWTGSAYCLTSGTDYDSTSVTNSITPVSGVVDIIFNNDGINDVQGWIDGTFTNNGLVIHSISGIDYIDPYTIASSDHATEAYRPKLVVYYETPLSLTQNYSLDINDATQAQSTNNYRFVDGLGGDVTTYKDNSLDQSDSTANYGAAENLYIGSPNGYIFKIIIQFNLSSIISNSICNTAALYLYRSFVYGSTNITVDVYSIASGNSGWVEGTRQGDTASLGESSWAYKAYNTVTWAGSAGLSTSGTDYESSILGTFESGYQDVVGTEYSIQLTASRIKDWFGTTNTNYGLVLSTPDDANGDAHRFASSDHATTGYRPKLVVWYETPVALTQNYSLSVNNSTQTQSTNNYRFVDGFGGDVTTYKDTGINGMNPDQNRGLELTTGINNGGYKALLEFDLSSIPATATCNSATLEIHVVDTIASSIYIYELTNANTDWIEGTSGDPESGGGATWDFRKDYNGSGDVAWAGSVGCSTSGAAKDTASADYVSTAIGTLTATGFESDGDELSTNLTTSAVEEWFGAANTNNGILLIRSVSNPRDIYLSDSLTTAYRPKLVVYYETPVALTQNYSLDVNDATQLHTSDNVNLTQNYSLDINDATQIITSHKVELGPKTVRGLDYSYRGEPWVRLAANSDIELNTLDYSYRGEPFWGVEGLMVPRAATQAQTAENVTLTAYEPPSSLTVQNATQIQTCENVSLTQHHVLTVQDSTQTQSTNNYRFVDGFGGDAQTYTDTYIDRAAPTTNYSTDTAIGIGEFSGWSDETQRTLIKFDIDNANNIPPSSTIISAVLSLYHISSGSWCTETNNSYVYRLKRAWVESESTWNIYSTGNNWQTAGGMGTDDCEQTPICTLLLAYNELDGEKQWNLDVSAIEEMISGGSWTNNGFLMRMDNDLGIIPDEGDNWHSFVSSDNATTGYRPKLVVWYETPLNLTQNFGLSVDNATQTQNTNNYRFIDGFGGDVDTACDTWVQSGSPDANNGTSDYLLISYSSDAGGLIKFTLTSLVGMTILNATLYLYSYNTNWVDKDCYFRRILSDNSGWTEAGATWNHSVGTTHWAGDTGGDHGTDAGCTVSGIDFSVTNLGVIDQAPHNPTPGEENICVFDITEFSLLISNNYGIKAYSENYGSAYFCSSDHATTAYRPKLVVLYEIPLNLTQNFSLDVNDTIQLQTSDNVTITYYSGTETLTVQNSTHLQTVENVVLIQHYILTINNTIHAQTAENIILTQRQTLIINNIVHSQIAGYNGIFIDGYGGNINTSKDTQLSFEYKDSNFFNANIITYNNGAGEMRGLNDFNLSSLYGYTITSASLSIVPTQDAYWQASNLYFHMILSGNSSWTETGATWNNQVGSTPWAGSIGCKTSGTDFYATELGHHSFTANEAVTGIEQIIQLNTAQVQEWVNGTYFGIVSWIDIGYIGIATSDHATITYRPKLIVEYIGHILLSQRYSLTVQNSTQAQQANISDTFVDGFGGDIFTAKDNTIASAINLLDNYGTSPNMRVGHDGAQLWRTLIKFDFSSLPDDCIVTSTTLTIYINLDISSNDRTWRIYRLKREWEEGTGYAVPGTSNWRYYDATHTWSSEGAFGTDDCEQTDIGSRLMGASETGTVNISLSPTTKTGLDLGYGWLIKADTENNDCLRFDSSDNSNTENRPKVTVLYTREIYLTQNNILTVQDSTHTQTVDSVNFTQNYALAVQDASHAHTVDNVALTHHQILLIQNSIQVQISENVSLSAHYALTVNNSIHTHTAENVALIQHHNLAVQDATQIHTAENVELSQHQVGFLQVLNSTHIHTAENVELSQKYTLTVNDATHLHTADGNVFTFEEIEDIVLTVHYTLAVNNATHVHTSENIILTAHYALTVDNTIHAHTADNINLTFYPPVGEIVVYNATQAQTSENVALTQHYSLIVNNSTQLQSVNYYMFQDGANGNVNTNTDAMINEEVSTYNFGTYTIVEIGHWSAYSYDWKSRNLIRFNLSSLFTNVTINSAILSLYCYESHSSNSRTFRVFRLKRNWVEGTRESADDNPPTGATWIRYDTTNNWETAGGFGPNDCEQTDIGSRLFTATETLNEYKNFELTPSAIQDWVNGTFSNNGLLLKADVENEDRYNFYSSNYGTVAYHPKLVIYYTVPITLTQHYILDINNATQLQISDNIVLSAHYTLLINNSSHVQYSDNILLTQHYQLAVQNSTHAQTSENVVLSAHYSIITNNSTHVQTSDNVALTQHHVLIVNNSAHVQTAENVTIIPSGAIAASTATHIQTSENVNLTQHHVLVVNNSAHIQISDNINLSQYYKNLVVNSAVHTHTSDNILLTQHHTLVINNTSHVQTSENVVLSAHYSITVNNSTHIHTGESVVLSAHYSITVNNSTHVHTSENVVLSAHYTIVSNNSTHTHTSENVVLSAHYSITVNNSTHIHTGESVVLSAHYSITVNNSVHTHTSENVVLSAHYSITTNNSIHVQTSESVALTQHHILVVNNATQLQTSDNVELSQHFTGALFVNNAIHAQTSDNVVLTQHHILTVTNSTQLQISDNVVLTAHYSITTNNVTQSQTSDNVSLSAHYSITTNNSTHVQTSENILLTAHYSITSNNSAHVQTAENVSLLAHYSITISSSSHLHTAENIILIQHHLLQVQNSTHIHTVDSVELSQHLAGAIQVRNSTHLQTSDTLALTQHHILGVNNSAHVHTAETVNLLAHYSLSTVNNTVHLQTADNLILVFFNVLEVNNTVHAQTAENIILIQHHVLGVNNTAHIQISENVSLSAHYAISTNNTIHVQTSGEVELEEHRRAVPDNSIHVQTSDELVLFAHYSLIVNDTAHILTSNVVFLGKYFLEINNSVHIHTSTTIDLIYFYVLETPTSRTFIILAENRGFLIEAEDRILVIEEEYRFYDIPPYIDDYYVER